MDIPQSMFESYTDVVGAWLTEVEAVANGDEVFGNDLEPATRDALDVSAAMDSFRV